MEMEKQLDMGQPSRRTVRHPTFGLKWKLLPLLGLDFVDLSSLNGRLWFHWIEFYFNFSFFFNALRLFVCFCSILLLLKKSCVNLFEIFERRISLLRYGWVRVGWIMLIPVFMLVILKRLKLFVNMPQRHFGND